MAAIIVAITERLVLTRVALEDESSALLFSLDSKALGPVDGDTDAVPDGERDGTIDGTEDGPNDGSLDGFLDPVSVGTLDG